MNKGEENKCQACVTGEGDHTCIENPEQYVGEGADQKISEIKPEPEIACRACLGVGDEHTCM